MASDSLIEFKNDLVTLIKSIVTPQTLTIDEITAFMNTGIVPGRWWTMIFERNISSDQMAEITDLMDSIHVDIAQEDASCENVHPEIVDDVPTPTIEKLPPTEMSPTHDTRNVPTNKDSESSSVKTSPKRKRGNFFPQPKKLSTQSHKVILSEAQMAENLFSLYIKQSIADKKLDLVKLCTIIGKNLSDHTVGHNPQRQEITLYDEKNNPITTFDVENYTVISI